MAHIVFNWFWHWLVGWGGVSLLVGIGAGAVWWFIPAIFTKVRALAFNVAIGALAFNAVYTMGFQNGASTTRAQWKADEQRAIERGGDAREAAEQEIPAAEPDQPVVDPEPVLPAPGVAAPTPRPRMRPAAPRWMSDDRYNRDNH